MIIVAIILRVRIVSDVSFIIFEIGVLVFLFRRFVFVSRGSGDVGCYLFRILGIIEYMFWGYISFREV